MKFVAFVRWFALFFLLWLIYAEVHFIADAVRNGGI